VTLRVLFPNPQDELFPGMYVRARIKQGIDADAIAVPQQAIHRTSDGKPEVWVVGDGDKVMLQPVEVGPVVDNTWIVRQGLKSGDRVVVDGVQKISPGLQVRHVEWEPALTGPIKPDRSEGVTRGGRLQHSDVAVLDGSVRVSR
jgi:membrane fusion protein (multidrug efflux system)